VDPNAILHVTNRLMGYHGSFLGVAERCLQTPVDAGVTVLLKDTSTLALCPLVSYDQFIVTLCHRVAEVRELLPYSHGREIAFESVTLELAFPRGLEERVRLQIARFGP
jgi:predicted membrane chloride channel (bestrophin family)